LYMVAGSNRPKEAVTATYETVPLPLTIPIGKFKRRNGGRNHSWGAENSTTCGSSVIDWSPITEPSTTHCRDPAVRFLRVSRTAYSKSALLTDEDEFQRNCILGTYFRPGSNSSQNDSVCWSQTSERSY